MSKTSPLRISLEGSVPSKKNSRINLRSGVSIPSNSFTQWQADALYQVRMQTRARFLNPVSVDVVIYYGTNAVADSDNRLTSILDMLVEAMVLTSDRWQMVPRGSFSSAYRKNQPGAEITITEI